VAKKRGATERQGASRRVRYGSAGEDTSRGGGGGGQDGGYGGRGGQWAGGRGRNHTYN